MPVFGPLAVQKMFPQMLDITSQMLMKWQRLPEGELIDPVDAFTRLTLDTIALCAFDYRFNSFYREDMHPFVHSALEALLESGRRAVRTSIETNLRFRSQQQYDEHIHFCWKLCDEIVADRKAHPKDVNDLLNVMLQSSDPDTGEKMRDELIRFEMMTFLLAGHDTTSGLLNFAFLLMLKNPRTLERAQREVDGVLGDGAVEVRHYAKLPYLEAVLRETLRLYPTAPSITRMAKGKEDTFVGAGKYRIRPDDALVIQLPIMQRDPKVWGEDAEEFRPERMLGPEGFDAKPPDSWKPFGSSFRMCIGRSLAWQEAWMTIALILQRFQVEMAEPQYELKLRQTLTIKPIGWHLKVRLRPGKSMYTGIVPNNGAGAQPGMASMPGKTDESQNESSSKKPLAIFYGSNAGSCKTFAEQVQSTAAAHGLLATVKILDSATEHVPTDRPVLLIAPSYEGQPADNAKRFMAWLESNKADGTLLQGVRYAVLGVGNSDWVSTFHRQPKLIDSLMEAMGAIKIIPTVLGDVSRDICGAYDEFTDSLWKALDSDAGAAAVAAAGLKLEVTLDRPELLGEKEMSLGTVKQHLQLADTSIGPEKRLMEVKLPGEASYVCGDYLVVLPTNHSKDVKRVLVRFGLPTDAMVKMSNTHKAFLPSDRAEYAFSLVAAYLEIGTPISRKQLSILAAATTDTSQQEEIQTFAAEHVYEESILAKRASIIDILEKYPACKITFAEYVDMLQPMLPRQYSIASSPLASPPGHATIVYDVLSGPSHFDPERPFHGTGSTYLSTVPVGGKVHCYVRSTNANFRLPLTQSTPVIMVCAGTGFAPMRGFIQERAAIAEAQKITPGKALLYFGCRDREKDFLCRSELEAWEKQGIVELRPTFSRAGSVGIGYKYVPDRLWAEQEEIVELFRAGAKVFLCGSASKLARSTNEVFEKIVREAKSCGLDEAKAFLDTIKQDRYVTDIFG
ncbi:hypothetical protein LTR86_009889 [Recurvomyces mirabilis]|nr:hypothetical protein LTR86_009889 [Recurvomyces mirabilis]